MIPRARYTLSLPTGSLVLGDRTLVMGIVNVTPDSFADGGLRLDPGRAVEDAFRMEAEGADVIDIGAESTRPGATSLPEREELARVRPVLEGLAGRLRVPVSVDTYKAGVASVALDLGAAIINDVTALGREPSLADVVATRGAALVLMHARGSSSDMYAHAHYEDVADEVTRELAGRVEVAQAAGVSRDRLLVDPGLGFAKRADQSYAALAGLNRLRTLDLPILVGPSRKSFVAAALGGAPPEDREWGTAAAVTAAVLAGAHVVRVHGVGAMVQVVRVADRIRAAAEADRSRSGDRI